MWCWPSFQIHFTCQEDGVCRRARFHHGHVPCRPGDCVWGRAISEDYRQHVSILDNIVLLSISCSGSCVIVMFISCFQYHFQQSYLRKYFSRRYCLWVYLCARIWSNETTDWVAPILATVLPSFHTLLLLCLDWKGQWICWREGIEGREGTEGGWRERVGRDVGEKGRVGEGGRGGIPHYLNNNLTWYYVIT